MATKAKPPERDDLAYLLAKASQRWDAVLAQRCRAHGFPEVRPAFGAVLFPLFDHDGLRIGELADWARISKQNMTTLVRDAERNGLVVRRADPDDGRATRVWLSPRAEAYRPTAERILADMDRLLGNHLSDRTVTTLQRALRTIKDLPDTSNHQPSRSRRAGST